MLTTCDTIVKYNFSELTNVDALSIIARGICAILEELIVTNNTYTNKDFLNTNLKYNIPEMHSSLIFIDLCIMYSRYNTKFNPLLNKDIEKVIREYRDH